MRTQQANSRAWIRWVEWGIPLLLTGAIVAMHVVNMRQAAGLWRDEAAAVRLATMPTFGDVWSHLEHESFPLLLTMSLRTWNAIGLGSDAGLRMFGFLIGLAVLAALWWNSWSFSAAPPTVSLLLFGLSPTLIHWGDSLRAYGLGVFFILISLGLIWKVVRAPAPRVVIGAMLAALLAVQSLYQNAFVLGVICVAGFFVAARRGKFQRGLLVLATAVPAALSLLPYRGVIARANEWNVATQTPIDIARIGTVLHGALNAPSPVMFWLWIGGLLAALLAVGLCFVRQKKQPKDDVDLAWFFLIATVGLTIVYYAFLKVMKFPTEVWYYLVWMAIVAAASDALIQRATRSEWLRLTRLAVVAAAAIFLFPSVHKATEVRMTNLDLVGRRLTEAVSKNDLVLVHPWFCGASLSRYYHGAAELMSLPPLADLQLQRLDLFKAQMQLEDPIQPVLEKIEQTLREGGIVWLVGYFPYSNPPRPPPKMPRAGEGPEGWRAAPYMTAYGMQVAYFLQRSAVAVSNVKIDTDQAVNPFENFPLQSISGWRSPRF